MKKCPQCGVQYSDDTITKCSWDGQPLKEGIQSVREMCAEAVGYTRKGDSARAIAILIQALPSATDTYETGVLLYDVGLAHLAAGRKAEAINAISNAMWIHPELLGPFKKDNEAASLHNPTDEETIHRGIAENSTSPCPLCGQHEAMQKPRIVYGSIVCKRCYGSFANRRQLAFAIDLVPAFIPVIQFLWVPFFLFKDGFGGCSIGKLICGVRVIHSGNGSRAGFGQSFLRNLPLWIPLMPLIVALALRSGHRTGDKWARTKVVWLDYAQHPMFQTTAATTDWLRDTYDRLTTLLFAEVGRPNQASEVTARKLAEPQR